MKVQMVCGLALALAMTALAAPKGPRRAVFGPGGNEASLKACCEFTGKAHPKTLIHHKAIGGR